MPLPGQAALRNAFQRARLAAPSILFLDELDALVGAQLPVWGGEGGRGRGALPCRAGGALSGPGQSAGKRQEGEQVQEPAARVLSTFLTEMDGMGEPERKSDSRAGCGARRGERGGVLGRACAGTDPLPACSCSQPAAAAAAQRCLTTATSLGWLGGPLKNKKITVKHKTPRQSWPPGCWCWLPPTGLAPLTRRCCARGASTA